MSHQCNLPDQGKQISQAEALVSSDQHASRRPAAVDMGASDQKEDRASTIKRKLADLAAGKKRKRSKSPEGQRASKKKPREIFTAQIAQDPAKLRRMCCIVRVNKKDAFGKLSVPGEFFPLLSLDANPKNPSITLMIPDDCGKALYENSWKIKEYKGEFAINKFSIYRPMDRPNRPQN